MTAFLIIAGWFVCWVLSYLMFRAFWRVNFNGDWRLADRVICMCLSLIGPASLIVSFIYFAAISLPAVDWNRRVKW